MMSVNLHRITLCVGIFLVIKGPQNAVAEDLNYTEFEGRPSTNYANPEQITPTTEALNISTESYARTEYVNISENGTRTQKSDSRRNVTIVVMGRSGSGISSTIRKLVGRDELPTLNENFLVKEYLLPSSETTFLKIIDVDGLVDGKTLEQDARILATLKSYLENQKETLGEDPDIFLVISRFDDNRYIGSQSTFAQVVKRAQVLQTSLYDKTQQNNIFLMTRFMSETKVIQRRPKQKIQLFQETIANYSLFQPPIHVAVGENLPEPETVDPEDGYTKLLNKEVYPKNVFNLMINLTKSSGSENAAAILEAFRDNPMSYPVPMVTGYPNNTNAQDYGELLTLIQLTSFDIEQTEVNLELLKAYESITDPFERQHIRNAIPMLQIHLQNSNIRLISQLPQRALDRVKFFQSLPPSLELATLKLLRKSINFLPEFVQQPLVGSSYDVTTDEALPVSPFKVDKLIASSVGYLLPSYIICSKLTGQSHHTKDHVNSVDQLEDYVKRRIQDLVFPERDSLFNVSSFSGKVKVGFNLSPEPGVIPSVSTVREVRKFIFQLDQNYNELNEEFLDESTELNPLKLSDRDSVTEWKQYFSKFGTHVVSSAYVGGRIEGLVVDNKIKNLTSAEKTELLREIVNFEIVSLENKPNYRFFGGELASDLGRIYQVSAESRSILLNEWFKSVSYDPIALDYELELVPISRLLKDVNATLAQEIQNAANLLISGNLVYKRVKAAKPKPFKASTPSSNIDSQSDILNSSRVSGPVTEPALTQYATSPPSVEKEFPDSVTNSYDTTSSTPVPSTARPRKRRRTTTQAPARIVPTAIYVPPNLLALMPESNTTKYMSSFVDTYTSNTNKQVDYIERETHKSTADNAARDAEEANRQATRRQQMATEEQRALEARRRKITMELETMRRQYAEQAESMRQITEEDIRRRQRQFEEELNEIERSRQQLLQTIQIITAENERRAKEEQQKACLKKGTLVLMADGSEKPVELVKVGDIVLDHELQPSAVVGTLEKFLMSDSFHGFSEDGPFFFTDTHIMLGPSDDNTGTQLFVNSLHELIQENPLMLNLNVKQLNRSGTNFLAYDWSRDETIVKFQSVFTDPVKYPPETLVHIIEVASPAGTYFANGYVCRHELPPLELWPNTINLILSLSEYDEVQRIGSAEYTIENIEKITEALDKIFVHIIAVIDGFNGNRKMMKNVDDAKTEFDMTGLITKVFENPMLSSFLVGLYGKVGVPVAEILDIHRLPQPPELIQTFRSTFTKLVLKEANSINFM